MLWFLKCKIGMIGQGIKNLMVYFALFPMSRISEHSDWAMCVGKKLFLNDKKGHLGLMAIAIHSIDLIFSSSVSKRGGSLW